MYTALRDRVGLGPMAIQVFILSVALLIAGASLFRLDVVSSVRGIEYIEQTMLFNLVDTRADLIIMAIFPQVVQTVILMVLSVVWPDVKWKMRLFLVALTVAAFAWDSATDVFDIMRGNVVDLDGRLPFALLMSILFRTGGAEVAVSLGLGFSVVMFIPAVDSLQVVLGHPPNGITGLIDMLMGGVADLVRSPFKALGRMIGYRPRRGVG